MVFLQIAVGMTGIFCILDAPMILHLIHLDSVPDWVAASMKWATAFSVLMGSFGLLFHMGLNADKEKWVTPGSIFGAVFFVLCSVGFRTFVQLFGHYGIYGPLAGVMVLLSWLYLSSYVLLIAAEMNRIVQCAAENRKLFRQCPPVECEHTSPAQETPTKTLVHPVVGPSATEPNEAKPDEKPAPKGDAEKNAPESSGSGTEQTTVKKEPADEASEPKK